MTGDTTSQRLRPIAHLVAIAMAETGEIMHRHVQRAAMELDLTPVQLAVMKFSEQPIRMGALAERLHCQPSYITSVVDSLESRGWVHRVADPTDRRALTVTHTKEGVAARARIEEHFAANGLPELSNLTEAEQQTLLDLLCIIIGKTSESLTLPPG